MAIAYGYCRAEEHRLIKIWQTQTDDKQLSDIAENILKNEEERKKISNQLFDEKTLLIYKDLFKLNQKSISYDDFVKLATEK